ncbi:MAG TPA: DNA polymerase III subunit gamma/tau [Bacteroidales bacterium]|nr:DNA polymerase III subunit gamma/tau [Bacteroidales bacterium]
MENYIVSARKYRPTTFESVVGQTNLTQTLRNAIATNHLAQAYLFCGPRGVGKTTCARIFAKTINCLHPTPEKEACNECESCRAFNEQRSFNIHELDAASNNSVDNIRTLIEQVRIPPQVGKYSVFIIDEVHMLSKDAFNALLKTLEEPPSYAIFILATTEKNKVIPTILSRCQVYDFSRITVNDIIRHLQNIARKEGVNASEEALNVVAQKADGGMRDALSIFDQLVSFCGADITYERTIDILNVLDADYYFKVVNKALENKVGDVLLLFNEILVKGFDALNFVIGLGSHLRNVLVSKNPETTVLLETSDAVKQNYVEQARSCTVAFLFKALDIINECDIAYRQSKNKRLTVELALIKLCRLSAPQEQVQPVASMSQPAPVAVASVQAKPVPPNAAQPVQSSQTMPSKTQPAVTSVTSANSSAKPVVGIQPHISIRSTVNTSGAPDANKSSSFASIAKAQPGAERNNSFTEKDFDKVWLTLPSNFPREERLKAMLLNARYRVQNTTVSVALANQLQAEEFETWKPKIVACLADALNNDAISLQIHVEEQTATGAAFTATEKYRHLVERNQELDNLRNMLGMHLE